MYTIKAESSFDSAHFLSGYSGKCSNLHGHRWRVILEIKSEGLIKDGHERGMTCDFDRIKSKLKEITEYFDHSFIYEEKSLKPATLAALKDENFRLIPVGFRPTSENFSKYFYDRIKDSEPDIFKVTVYETPNNCATYSEYK